MRSYGASFAAEILTTAAIPFWTVRLRFTTGDVFAASRRATIGGNAHTVILNDVGAINGSGRHEPTAMDVLNCDLTFINMPMPSGAPGQLTSGQRIIDRYTRTMQNVLADIYLNFQKPDSTIVQELMVPGVLQLPNAGYILCSQRVSSLCERYLNASIHRTLSSITYPFIRSADVRQTIPIVIGSVPKSPGRIVKRGFSSTPVADSDNIGNAELIQVTAVDPVSVETWTVAFQPPETVEYTTTPNTDQPLNTPAFVGYPNQPIRAQSFTLSQPEILQSVTVRLKSSVNTGRNVWRLEIWSDSGGNPHAPISNSAKIAGFVGSFTTYTDHTYKLPRISLTDGVTYWLVAIAETGGDPNVATGDVLYWGSNSGGGYAGGKAKAGTLSNTSYGTNASFWGDHFDTAGRITWDSTLDAHDLWFQLGFVSNAYTLTGSVTGLDGAGTVGADFESDSGVIQIKAADWQGTPHSGDSFTFDVDPAPSKVILSESPADTPVSAINAVYWDDTRVATGTGFSNTPGWGGTIVHIGNTIWRAKAQSFDVTGTESFRRLGFQIRRNGTPTSPVRFQLRRDDSGQPSEAVLSSIEIPATHIPANGSTPGMTLVTIPLAGGTAETLWIVVDTDQNDASNYYGIAASPDDTALPGTPIQQSVDGTWSTFSNDLGCEAVGASIITNVSTDDGTGSLVALITIDAEIPEGVIVTADVDGISDDTSGTYSGVPSSVLTVPGHVFHWFLARAGVPTASIDLDDTFAISNAAYGSLYSLNGVSQTDITFKALLLKLAYECRSVFGWTLKAELKFIPDTYPTPLRTFELADIVADSNRVPKIQLAPMAMEEVINSLVANYNREAATTKYKSTVSRYAPDSVSAFGVLKRTDLENLDFVRNEAQARAILDLRLRRQAFPAWRAAFTTLLPFIDMEQDDPVALDLTNAAAGGDALGGWDGTQTFQIEAANPQPSIFGVDFVLREVNIPVNLLDGDPTLVGASAIVVFRDQTTGDLVDVNFGATPLTQTTPSVSGGTPFDAILLANGYYVYVDNGLLGASNTVTPTDVLPWSGFPPITTDANGGLVVG